jgi:glucoamylase
VAQHRSLIEGIAIASEIGVECIDCEAQAPAIRCLMSQLWNSEGYMMSDINNSHDRTGKGTNTVIASIHS